MAPFFPHGERRNFSFLFLQRSFIVFLTENSELSVVEAFRQQTSLIYSCHAKKKGLAKKGHLVGLSEFTKGRFNLALEQIDTMGEERKRADG
jgi:hypothetical protein